MSSELSPPSGFTQLPSVLNSREAARVLRIGGRSSGSSSSVAIFGGGAHRTPGVIASPSPRCWTSSAEPSAPNRPRPIYADAIVVGVQVGAVQKWSSSMPAYRDRRSEAWRYRKRVRLLDGSTKRVEGTPSLNTKLAAEQMERAHIERILRGEPEQNKKEVPTLEKFAPEFLGLSRVKNKPSEADTKEMILRCHLVPAFGQKPLDLIGYAAIQDYAAKKVEDGLAKKTVNNHLTVMRRLLVVAKKRGTHRSSARDRVAEGAEAGLRLPHLRRGGAAHSRGRPGVVLHITVAIKTGLRQGELLALRREDVDLVAGLLRCSTIRDPGCGDGAEEREGEGRRIG